MKNKQQRGITLIGFIIVLIIVGFFGFIGMKLFPMYSEYFSVVQAMKSVAAENGVAKRTPAEVKDMLFKRFYISYVDSVKAEHVKVSKAQGYQLKVKYEVRKSLIGNLDVVAIFDETVDLSG